MRRGVRERLRQRASSSVGAGAQDLGATSLPPDLARQRSAETPKLRPWRESAHHLIRPATLMEVEFIPDKNASRAERREAIQNLRAKGVKVTVRE